MKVKELIEKLNSIKNIDSEVYIRIDKPNDKFTLHGLTIKEDYEYIMLMQGDKVANGTSFIN